MKDTRKDTRVVARMDGFYLEPLDVSDLKRFHVEAVQPGEGSEETWPQNTPSQDKQLLLHLNMAVASCSEKPVMMACLEASAPCLVPSGDSQVHLCVLGCSRKSAGVCCEVARAYLLDTIGQERKNPLLFLVFIIFLVLLLLSTCHAVLLLSPSHHFNPLSTFRFPLLHSLFARLFSWPLLLSPSFPSHHHSALEVQTNLKLQMLKGINTGRRRN